ncbi:hypothetical protein P280DRAFT_502924 [Massarina eburnea CBS 473.64]|uniref:Uncharacterized protein n=1 Tax=Massarina eburnea CBS 473.64 TaxID=1395130 RepID=A0A6A6SGZ5_9PLEO|nr:hypothetical protein P280DRAFT_502924 [Massarina eburnea CBS 473.64]
MMCIPPAAITSLLGILRTKSRKATVMLTRYHSSSTIPPYPYHAALSLSQLYPSQAQASKQEQAHPTPPPRRSAYVFSQTRQDCEPDAQSEGSPAKLVMGCRDHLRDYHLRLKRYVVDDPRAGYYARTNSTACSYPKESLTRLRDLSPDSCFAEKSKGRCSENL